jgi:hypothetical protein
MTVVAVSWRKLPYVASVWFVPHEEKVGESLLAFCRVVALGRVVAFSSRKGRRMYNEGVLGTKTLATSGREDATKPSLSTVFGWVAEWSKAAVLKTAVGASPPGVRIPPHPLCQKGALARGQRPEVGRGEGPG